jgi:hypothetical protein
MKILSKIYGFMTSAYDIVVEARDLQAKMFLKNYNGRY